MKIGIVGGTFDPIHVAHAYLMEECHHILGLDRLLVIPNGDPPHKDTPVTMARHRLAMVKLALSDYEGLEVSNMETDDPMISYTYRTLEKLKKAHPEDDLFFIMGGDSLIGFHAWRRPDVIIKLASLVCFDRPKYRSNEVTMAALAIREQGGNVILVDSLDLEISSTDIRQRIANGISHRSFLHPAVYEYIHCHGLYQRVRDQ